MSFFSKLINFIKNAHPIRNFAKPLPKKQQFEEKVSVNYTPVALSYEALKEDLANHQEITAVSYPETISTYATQETYPAFQNSFTQTEEEHEEEPAHQQVMVVRKLEITPERSLVLEAPKDLEAPLAPDTIISEIVDLSQYQEATPEPIEVVVNEAIVEAVPVDTPKKTRKRTPKADPEPVAKKSAKIAKTPAKKIIKKVTKPVASTKASTAKAKTPTTRTRKKSSPPPEAMGFGF